MKRPLATLLLRCFVGAGLLTWLTFSRDINWLAVARRLTHIQPVPLVGAVLAVAASHVLAIAAVRLILRNRSIEVGFVRMLSNHFRGLFAAQFLPTPVAGDIVRIHDLHSGDRSRLHNDSRSSVGDENHDEVGDSTPDNTAPHDDVKTTESLPPAWQSVTWALAVQRGVNLVASLLIFSCAVYAAEFHDLTAMNRVACSLLVAAVVGYFTSVSFRRSEATLARVRLKWFGRVLVWIPPVPLVLRVLMLGIAQQAALIVAVACVAVGLEIAAPLERIVALVPLSLLAVILPVSINGLGVRESVYVAVLTPVGIHAPESLSLSLSMFALSLIFSLAGLTVPGIITKEQSRI